MMDIPSISPSSRAALSRISARRAAAQSGSGAAARGGDSVEVSTAATFLGKLADLPDVRHDLVDRVKSEIKQGHYETPEKLDTAVESMIDDAQFF